MPRRLAYYQLRKLSRELGCDKIFLEKFTYLGILNTVYYQCIEEYDGRYYWIEGMKAGSVNLYSYPRVSSLLDMYIRILFDGKHAYTVDYEYQFIDRKLVKIFILREQVV